MLFSKAVETVSDADVALMRRIHQWPAPRWVRVCMLTSTRGGDGWLWAFCGVAVLASHDRDKVAACLAAALAAAFGILVFTVLNRAVGRPRPCTLQPHCWANLLPPDQFSFPSGHSITAFAVALPFSLFYPALAPVLLPAAGMVALSRMILGLHFLTDVIAGAAIGAVLGALGYLAVTV
jgi:undecaprenyl-diphosphatase